MVALLVRALFRPRALPAPLRPDVERRDVVLALFAVVRVVPRFVAPRFAVPLFFAAVRVLPRFAVAFVAPRFVPPRVVDLLADRVVPLARVRPVPDLAAPRFVAPRFVPLFIVLFVPPFAVLRDVVLRDAVLRLVLFDVLRPLLFRAPPLRVVLPALVALAPRAFTLPPREVAPADFRVRDVPVDLLLREDRFVPPDACERVAMLRS